MKNLTHIINKVYGKAWCIQPRVLQSIQSQLSQVLLNGITREDKEVEPMVETIIHPALAIIEVDGVIGKHLDILETMCGGVDVDEVSQKLIAARDNPEIKMIAMLFNTPGGTVTGVPELGQLIKEVSTVKKVIGYTDTLCASAGMWLASQCEVFFASPSSEIGSVGVYSIYLDESQALAIAGIKVNAIVGGKYKITGASFNQMSDEERAMLQEDVDATYNLFKSTVTSNRPDIKDDDMQGQTFNGLQAAERGFVDGIYNSKAELLADILADLSASVDNKP